MTKVANPIYDVVFKYLMEDNRIAKLLVSSLIEMEVLDLEMKPQEYATEIKEKTLTIYRIDFKARIRTENGEELVVLIELQKAKFSTDIMRFRRYLGKQYADPNNTDGDKALPLISIYFLGYPLKNYPTVPIIKVSRLYIDHATKDPLGDKKEEFIESLTHDSIIVQVQAIKNKERRTRLEEALSVFEQGTIHEVSVNDKDYPEEYRPIIRRLIRALADPQVREIMDAEDDILREFQRQERILLETKEKLEKEKEEAVLEANLRAQKEREEKEEAKRKEKEAKQKEQEAKRKEKEAKQKEQEAKRKEQEAKRKLARKMLKYGEPIDEIIKETGLSKDEIEKL